MDAHSILNKLGIYNPESLVILGSKSQILDSIKICNKDFNPLRVRIVSNNQSVVTKILGFDFSYSGSLVELCLKVKGNKLIKYIIAVSSLLK